jgi:hypothetical protein
MCEPNTYNTLRFVDCVEGNFLFRGGDPLNCKQDENGNCIKDAQGNCTTIYDYEGLAEAMIRNCPPYAPFPTYNQSGLPPFYLVDVNLLHTDEVSNIEFALDYYKAHPAQGRLHLWDTDGTPLCYFSTPAAERERRVATLEQWLPDPLIWRVAALRRMLQASELPIPVVVYVHCDGGCDRTAEMIGAYRLRYMAQSWQTVWGEQPCGRPLGCDNYRALQWYAFWLNQTLGFSLTGIGEDLGCSDPGGARQPCSPAPPGGR